MQTATATKIYAVDSDFRYNPEKGLHFKRMFTEEGKNPFELFEYELRTSIIKNIDGTLVFEMNDVEVPKTWSQVATDVVAQKYFRKAGVPQYNGDGTPQLDEKGHPVLGTETSIKQVAHRLAGTWRYWAEKYGYFASQKDAEIFYDEMVYMIIGQITAPNSPQWFNTGLYWAYGINGPAQGHYYVDQDTAKMTKAKDSYSHPQPHACGRYDTKLYTEKGILNLGEIVEENMIDLKIYDGEKYVAIQAVKNNGVRKLFRALLKNGNYIEFTDDHRILTSEKRLKDGGKYDWKELDSILGDKVKQLSLSYENKIEKIDEEKVNKASLAGFVVGDGYYGKYGRNKKTTLFGVITINEDEFSFVTDLFKNIFGEYKVAVKNKISDLYRIVKRDSKTVDEYVEEYELNQSSYTVKVPDVILQGSKQEKVLFLQSLFQADGCVRMRNKDGRNSGDVVLTSISEELVHGVQVLLLELGIYSNVTKSQDARDNRKDPYQLSISYFSERKKYQELIGFISDDKKEKLENLNKEIIGKDKDDLSEETVVSVEYIGEEEVYDIQTESGQFCANGVVVHNCFIQSVKDDLVGKGGIMDLWVREARLFKYGSGTGSNFSTLRGSGEPLSGGGTSSGLMSWLKIGDRAAGAIKSGGTTRRAAKMVILDVDHPDIEEFIEWKVNEEKKVAAMVAAGYDSSYEGEAYQTVSGQNSNNTIRVTQDFMEAVNTESDWGLKWRTNGYVFKTLPATELWDKIAQAAWSCADPGLQFDTTINEWHTCPNSGRINASNPCSEYMFLDDTACNLASINLAHFYNPETSDFDVEKFRHTVRLWTTVLETSVLMAQYPSEEIAQGSYDFRTLGLGYANIGSVLMTAGMPYDSPEALAFSGSITAILTAESYATSAEIAKNLGAFAKYDENKEDMLRVIRNHRRAVFNSPEDEYENLEIKPVGIDEKYAPAYLLAAARESWNKALDLGERYGYRNAQTTVLAPTGTIGLVMDCATTGVEPDFALVKFKKLSGGGYFKIANEAVPTALKTLNYTPEQITDIISYLKGYGTLKNSPGINHENLKAKGFIEEDLEKLEKALPAVFELSFAFNSWTLGDDCLKRLGFGEKEYNAPQFNLLDAMGYTGSDIAKANEYVCGAMAIEDAPHLKKEHYSVFDTANKNGNKGQRYIHYLGHIRMMAAVQPFISGAISKTVNMPNEASLDDVKIAYMASWKLGLKANAIYRDGCKLSQPLTTKTESKEDEEEESTDAKALADKEEVEVEEKVESIAVEAKQVVNVTQAKDNQDFSLDLENKTIHQLVANDKAMMDYAHDGTDNGNKIYLQGEQRKMPYKRMGMTIKSSVGGQKVFLRTGEYPDGKLGEVFIDMYKEGASFRSILNLFAISVSTGLQYGVPLKEYVDKFTFTRFEPSGITDHPNIRSATSIVDFIFRVLGMEYEGRTDFVQVKPKGIQKNRAEQMAKVASEIQGQKTMELGDKENKDEILKRVQDDKEIVEEVIMEMKEELIGGDVADQQLSGMMGDAPPCPTCGHITIRSGSCYKCLNCGSTTGCS